MKKNNKIQKPHKKLNKKNLKEIKGGALGGPSVEEINSAYEKKAEANFWQAYNRMPEEMKKMFQPPAGGKFTLNTDHEFFKWMTGL